MVIDLAKGLIGLGVNKGDSVAIVSHTRWEWTALDMAIMSIGALTVPVYETNSASQVSWIFNDSKSRSPSPKMTDSATRSNPCAARYPPCATCS